MALGRTTYLSAVNQILRSIGEREVASYVDSTRGDVSSSVSELEGTSKAVLGEGWHFNHETRDYSPEPDGRIPVPLTALSAGLVGPISRDEVIMRGGYFYNKTDSTYIFTADIKVDVILDLEWDELPEAARQYIVARAARRVAEQRVGDQLLIQTLQQEEGRTRVVLENEETESGDYNHNMAPSLRRLNSEWHR